MSNVFESSLTSVRAVLARRFSLVDPLEWQISQVEGLTGINWKVSTPEGHAYLLRPQTQQKTQLGINRKRESHALRLAANAAIAPQCLGIDAGWLITEWIHGQALTDTNYFSHLPALAEKIVALHRLKPAGQARDFHRHCQRYYQLSSPHWFTPQALSIHQYWQSRALPTPLKFALLHMDIHPGNIIQTSSGLRLIDWEYAAVGDIALDLAAMYRSFGWTETQQRYFTDLYVRAGGYADIEKLQQHVQCWLPRVDYMAWLWYEVRWQQSKQNSFREAANLLLSQLLAQREAGR
ncbi:phosphotransferase [Hafnia paralvei]|uniref:phosphotransferase n=1 Tax=Hafnia paralvei TaxID=546367 RepID=UPI001C03A9CC|nr:phosphotransferase [Hafnia paralvei]MBU2674673.1 phosphotransferase [Hafnia paralvei]